MVGNFTTVYFHFLAVIQNRKEKPGREPFLGALWRGPV